MLVADAEAIESGLVHIRLLLISDVKVGKKLVGTWWWRGCIQVRVGLLTVVAGASLIGRLEALADSERAGATAKSRGQVVADAISDDFGGRSETISVAESELTVRGGEVDTLLGDSLVAGSVGRGVNTILLHEFGLLQG